jgi:4-hydroxy-tetrahydrodipicolinate synthase
MSMGADGVISVVSNAVPRAMSDLTRAASAGDFGTARRLHFRILPLMKAAFVESNPIPIKAALAELGRGRDTVRLPLVPLAETHRRRIREALAAAVEPATEQPRLSTVR